MVKFGAWKQLDATPWWPFNGMQLAILHRSLSLLWGWFGLDMLTGFLNNFVSTSISL